MPFAWDRIVIPTDIFTGMLGEQTARTWGANQVEYSPETAHLETTPNPPPNKH